MERMRYVPIALPLGAATLIGSENSGGLTWAGRFPHRTATVVALLRRALALDEDCQ
jgi:hypothetical protein